MHKKIALVALALALILLTHASAGTANAAAPFYHVVLPGQTLSGIAAWYGVSTYSLAYINGIWNPNLVYVGQVLLIPRAVYAPAPPVYAAPVLYYPRPTVGCNYFVRYGDTLLNIAARFGNDAWTIARANGIYNLNWIWAGMRLFIPGCSSSLRYSPSSSFSPRPGY
ncbi:MAG: LysM peptidoglycan-binding domain-containing protein [Chloroflexi bacterium]|nr:LysM peptidoglycan-binding domain-containing protein [Chloroflexota bacterium]